MVHLQLYHKGQTLAKQKDQYEEMEVELSIDGPRRKKGTKLKGKNLEEPRAEDQKENPNHVPLFENAGIWKSAR